jgi:phage shock protein A
MADESAAQPPSKDPDEPIDAEIVPLEPSGPTDPTVPAAVVPVVPAVDPGYTADGVPTFESVREKIENRYGTAIGAAELASETPEGRSVEEQYEARQKAAAERLEEIRRSMRDS